MANIKVRLKDASQNVLHPETDWSVVLNKPSIKLKYTDGSYSTDTGSKVAVVSGLVGRDSEAWDTYSNGGKSIVIGNSHNALGFCGDNSKRFFTVLQSKHSILINTAEDIKITSSATNNQSVSLANYPINWSALNMNNGPFKETLDLHNYDGSSHAKTSIQNAVFGIYSVVSGNTISHYPAFAIVSGVAGGIYNRDAGYYLNSSGNLTKITNMSNFSGFLDY